MSQRVDFELASYGGSYFKIEPEYPFHKNPDTFRVIMCKGGGEPFEFLCGRGELYDLKEWLSERIGA